MRLGKCTREGCDLEVPTDFLVEVSAERDAVVLQITDPQVLDSSFSRVPDRLGQTHIDFYKPENRQKLCYDHLTETITEVNPDLIIVTGDIVYGEFDDQGIRFKEFVDFMEGFGIQGDESLRLRFGFRRTRTPYKRKPRL